MTTYSNLDVVCTDWQSVRSRVAKVNPEFARLVDEINPDSSYRLYVAKYLYGAQILDNGDFFLPGTDPENNRIPFMSDSVPKQMQEDLNYNLDSNPISMVLHNKIESFVALEDRIVPFSVISPGNLFGMWRSMDALATPDYRDDLSHTSIFIWGMTAGARSIFMLPKISEALAHNKLKQAMRIYVDKPNSLLDHWKVFRSIAQQDNFPEPWHAELLFFSKKWRDSLNQPTWLKLHRHLLNMVWQNTAFWRNQFVWNLTFTRIQALRKIKASPYIADVVKHLLAIGIGAFPGFRPALNDDLAPIKGIQQIYTEHYELKEYAPIIMQPGSFDLETSSDPIYYSLLFPTACELAPKTSGRSSAISDLYDVRALLNKYLQYINDQGLNIEHTPLSRLAKHIEFNYYHNNVELYEGMRESQTLLEYDPNFKKAMESFPNREFPRNSAFVKGAIAISRITDTKNKT